MSRCRQAPQLGRHFQWCRAIVAGVTACEENGGARSGAAWRPWCGGPSPTSLGQVAKHRQVIVFTNDNRLPAAVRHLQLDARTVSRLA